MIRSITISIAILLGALVFGAIAQTIQSGSTTGTFSGNFLANSGSAAFPSYSFLAGPTAGAYFNGGYYCFSTGGTSRMCVDTSTTGVQLNGSEPLNWGNGAPDAVLPDTGISRNTAGVIAIGNGTAGNHAGGYVTGTASLTSLTTGTNADFLCLGADGSVFIQTTACTISSLRFKPDWKPYADNALTKISSLDVGTFHLNTGPNADPNANSLQAGLSAESVAAIAPECAIYENDMKTPKSYRQECVIALLVKAIQQMKK